MDVKLKQQLEQLLQESEVEERVVTLMERALQVDIHDAWLRDLFKLAATFLKQIYGEEANQVMPWFLFSCGVAWGRRRDVIHPE